MATWSANSVTWRERALTRSDAMPLSTLSGAWSRQEMSAATSCSISPIEFPRASDMDTQPEVLYEVRGQCAIITLNRPDQRNAIDRATCALLWRAFEDFDKDPALRVAILTGAGDKAFSAGRDLKEAAREEGLPLPPLPLLGDTLHVGKPVIAAVNGVAIAGGWVFAQMCDLCIAADTATFGITEPKVGRGVGWSPPMIRMLGSRIALELMLTGRTIDAQRAYEIGCVNRVVPRAQLLEAALEMADDIIACAPLS